MQTLNETVPNLQTQYKDLEKHLGSGIVIECSTVKTVSATLTAFCLILLV